LFLCGDRPVVEDFFVVRDDVGIINGGGNRRLTVSADRLSIHAQQLPALNLLEEGIELELAKERQELVASGVGPPKLVPIDVDVDIRLDGHESLAQKCVVTMVEQSLPWPFGFDLVSLLDEILNGMILLE